MAARDDATAWSVKLPAGLYEVAVPAPPECTSMAHLRGQIAPGAPAFGVLSTRARNGRSAYALAEDLARDLTEAQRPTPATVTGARDAARVDGRIDMEEGLTEDGIERISVVVAERTDDFVVLTIRTRPEDDVERAIAALVAGFEVTR